MQGFARSAARLETNAFDERALTIPWRGGELRGRLYTPRGASDRAMLLVPGVHAAGVDEPRLIQFARDLASVRHTVLTAELADLKQYRITPRTTDMIEDAALWLSQQNALAPDGRVGMMGISFAGGLSIVAASRPSHPRPRRVRDVVRRPRRSAAHAAVSLHRDPGGRHAPSAARLRRGHHPAERRGARRPAGPGGAAARGDPDVSRGLAARHGGQTEVRRRNSSTPAPSRRRCRNRRAR